MKLGIFATHPIQYYAPLWRRLAATPGLEVVVYFFSDQSVRGGVDPGFGVPVAWDVPLLDGYQYRFVTKQADIARPLSVRLPSANAFLRGERLDAVMFGGYTNAFEIQIRALAKSLNLRLLMRGEFTDEAPAGSRSAIKRRLRSAILRRFYSGVDAFCGIGQNARAHLLGHGVASEKIFFSPYSVDSSLFEQQKISCDRASARKALKIPDDACAVLFSGKFIERKAPLTLIEAVGKASGNENMHLILLGDGVLSKQVLSAAHQAVGDRLIMPGFVNQSELGRYFMAADIFVLPSRFETWGLVVNEAMQFGLPVIVSDAVGCRRDLVVEGETGFIFPVGDSQALASAISRLEQNRELRAHMGRKATAHVSKYSTEHSAAGVLEALDSLKTRRT